jgi:hypothetical protein
MHVSLIVVLLTLASYAKAVPKGKKMEYEVAL